MSQLLLWGGQPQPKAAERMKKFSDVCLRRGERGKLERALQQQKHDSELRIEIGSNCVIVHSTKHIYISDITAVVSRLRR